MSMYVINHRAENMSYTVSICMYGYLMFPNPHDKYNLKPSAIYLLQLFLPLVLSILDQDHSRTQDCHLKLIVY